MSIQVGIIEDNEENIKTLQYILKEVDHEVEIISIARTLKDARDLLMNPKIDLAFVDIRLRKGTSFEILDELIKDKKDVPELVFVTAYGSFQNAIKAIQFACLDFVTKPFDETDINNTLQRFIEKKAQTSLPVQHAKKPQSEQIQLMLELLQGNMLAPKSMGIILARGVIEFIELVHVVYLEADDNTCRIQMDNADNVLHSMKHLGYYIDLLIGNHEFIQISKSQMINMHHLKRYDHSEKRLTLNSGNRLYASQRFGRHLKRRLLERQQKKSGFFAKLFDS